MEKRKGEEGSLDSSILPGTRQLKLPFSNNFTSSSKGDDNVDEINIGDALRKRENVQGQILIPEVSSDDDDDGEESNNSFSGEEEEDVELDGTPPPSKKVMK